MNTDDFEKRLREQTPRSLPPQWRAEILAAARAVQAKGVAAATPDVNLSIWVYLRGRFPQAWGALAGIWLVLLGANFVFLGDTGSPAGVSVVASNRESPTVWRLQCAAIRQLARDDWAEVEETPKAAPATPASPSGGDRRGEGRRDLRAGCPRFVLA